MLLRGKACNNKTRPGFRQVLLTFTVNSRCIIAAGHTLDLLRLSRIIKQIDECVVCGVQLDMLLFAWMVSWSLSCESWQHPPVTLFDSLEINHYYMNLLENHM